jgi:phosphoribosyl-ATP pyrophosphohydrolase/phosphoribosyl-AMP cyclohydrolase
MCVPDAGLWPAVVQDVDTGAVLMLAWTNPEALAASHATGRAHFFSRSRGTLWDKGSTSGQVLELVSIRGDCDGDAYLYQVRARHGACHTGAVSCFGDATVAVGELGRLARTQQDRIREATPDASYTRRLWEQGPDRVLRKVGEEAAEFVIAVKNQDPREVTAEAADLLYHLLLALHTAGVSLDAVAAELRRRDTGGRVSD